MELASPDVDVFRETEDAAMRLLARREHSRAELGRKLRNGSRDEEVIASVLDRLQENGLQSDQRYTENFIRRRAGQGYGPGRISQELRQARLDPELFQAELYRPEHDWHQRMREVWHKKFGEHPSRDFKDRQKQVRFLMYRGFAGDEIRELLDSD